MYVVSKDHDQHQLVFKSLECHLYIVWYVVSKDHDQPQVVAQIIRMSSICCMVRSI